MCSKIAVIFYIKNRNLNTPMTSPESYFLKLKYSKPLFLAGATVEVLANESGIVNGIFFQDEMMRKMFEKFPEVLLIDATCKQIKL